MSRIRNPAKVRQICSLRPVVHASKYDLVKGLIIELRRPEEPTFCFRGQIFADLAIFARDHFGIPITSGTGSHERNEYLKQKYDTSTPPPTMILSSQVHLGSSRSRGRFSRWGRRGRRGGDEGKEDTAAATTTTSDWVIADGPVRFTESEFVAFLGAYVRDRHARLQTLMPAETFSETFPFWQSIFALGVFVSCCSSFVETHCCFQLSHFWQRLLWIRRRPTVAVSSPEWTAQFHAKSLLFRLPFVKEEGGEEGEEELLQLTLERLRESEDSSDDGVIGLNGLFLESLALPFDCPKWVGFRRAVGMFALVIGRKNGGEEEGERKEIDPRILLGKKKTKTTAKKEEELVEVEGEGEEKEVEVEVVVEEEKLLESLWEPFSAFRDFRFIAKPEDDKLIVIIQKLVEVRPDKEEEEGEIEILQETPSLLHSLFPSDLSRVASFIDHILSHDAENTLVVESIRLISARALRTDVGYLSLLLAQVPFVILPNLRGELRSVDEEALPLWMLANHFEQTPTRQKEVEEAMGDMEFQQQQQGETREFWEVVPTLDEGTSTTPVLSESVDGDLPGQLHQGEVVDQEAAKSTDDD